MSGDELPAIDPVECGACVACCRKMLVPLMPADNPRLPLYRVVQHPVAGSVLAQQPNGDCTHLGPDGCEVYPDHPVVCRVFHCGKQFLRSTREDRRYMLRRGLASAEVFAEGRRRAKELRP